MIDKHQGVELHPGGSAEPIPVSVVLVQEIGEVVRSRTALRFAALYPAAMLTVAINDGAHISTIPARSLHQSLGALLGSTQRWLLFDARLESARIVEVVEAQDILCRQAQTDPSTQATDPTDSNAIAD